MKILSKEEIITLGIEFAGDVCYSGLYGQQVYTKEMEGGGVPIDGKHTIWYEDGKVK